MKNRIDVAVACHGNVVGNGHRYVCGHPFAGCVSVEQLAHGLCGAFACGVEDSLQGKEQIL